MFFRKYFVTAIFVTLLIWGPIDNTWPASLAIRLGYLILIPLIVAFLLNRIWDKWKPNARIEDILERTLSSIICGTLIIMAIFEIQAKTHLENDHWIRTRDGMEAVGEDILVKGPDYGHIFIFVVIAICVFWFGVLKRKFKAVDY
jgi:hypothetical protein